MTQYESPLMIVLKGMIGGLLGTVALTLGMMVMPGLMQRLGLAAREPAGTVADRSRHAGGSTEELVERIATGVLETAIEEDARKIAGQTIHWSYGAAWGAVYALLQSSFRLPYTLHGLLLGGVTAVVALTMVPAIGLTDPPTKQPASGSVMTVILHLLYGWVTALTYRTLSPSQ